MQEDIQTMGKSETSESIVLHSPAGSLLCIKCFDQVGSTNLYVQGQGGEWLQVGCGVTSSLMQLWPQLTPEYGTDRGGGKGCSASHTIAFARAHHLSVTRTQSTQLISTNQSTSFINLDYLSLLSNKKSVTVYSITQALNIELSRANKPPIPY